jgi:prophage antirepressor-like protein
MTKVTAENLTDEQIREVRDEAWAIYADCCRALGFSPFNGSKYAAPESARAHRYRVAAVINARRDVKGASSRGG